MFTFTVVILQSAKCCSVESCDFIGKIFTCIEDKNKDLLLKPLLCSTTSSQKLCVCVSRCSLMGFDLNRHWQDPSPWAHPTLHAVKQLIVQMNQDPVSKHTHTHTHMHEHTYTHARTHTHTHTHINLCSSSD